MLSLFRSCLVFMLSLPATVAVAETPVRLVFSADLMPISFNQAGEVRGILPDVSAAVFDALGIEVRLAVYPWERAQEMVRQGAADGFVTNATSMRRGFAECGRVPVLRTPLHPIVRRNHPAFAEIAAITELEGLRDFIIVSNAGNGWAKEHLVEAGFNVFFAPDYDAQFRGLANGRGDLALVTRVAGDFFQRAHALEEDLVMLPQVIDMFEYVLCLGRQSPHLGKLADFEAELGRKRQDGSYAAILEYYGLKPSTPF